MFSRIAVLLIVLTSCVPATAQPLGSFLWQLQPYCNLLALNVAHEAGVYTLDGIDDRCGVGQPASARGMAFLNANGTFGFGLTMVQPGGTPVHLEATFDIQSLSGTWRDSTGAFGNFVLTRGAGVGGSPRPVPASGLPPASITSVQLAEGAVGASAIARDAIIGANIVNGSVTMGDLRDPPKGAFAQSIGGVALAATATTIVAVDIVVPPSGGRLLVNTSGYFVMGDAVTVDYATCSIGTSTNVEAPYAAVAQERFGSDYYILPFGGSRGIFVPPGLRTVRLVCRGSGAVIIDPSITATFVAEDGYSVLDEQKLDPRPTWVPKFQN